MSNDEIKELIQMFMDSGVAEMEVQRGENRVRIRRVDGRHAQRDHDSRDHDWASASADSAGRQRRSRIQPASAPRPPPTK